MKKNDENDTSYKNNIIIGEVREAEALKLLENMKINNSRTIASKH